MKITVTVVRKIFGRLIKKTASVDLPDDHLMYPLGVTVDDYEQNKIKMTVEKLLESLNK